MTNARLGIVAVILLLVGLAAGLVVRSLLLPPQTAPVGVESPSSATIRSEPRGVQYFEANIDEARRVAADCREGTIRGDECANADTALVTVESKKRFHRFRNDR
jgi:hypothetical protein